MSLRVPLLPQWVRWFAVIGLAAFIFYTSIFTTPPKTVINRRPESIPLDKLQHFIAYAMLAHALAYAATDWDWNRRTLAIFVIGVTVVYGVGIESGQSLTNNRGFSVGDVYANLLGAILVIPWCVLQPHMEYVSFFDSTKPD